jgi:hypothetical protein
VTAAVADRLPGLDDRPVLPLPLMAILLGEIAVLGALVAMFGTQPPYAYEAGWAGAASMVAMQVYSLRRRIPALRNFGSLRSWLDAHVFLGMQGFVLAAYHSVGISAHTGLAAANFAIVAVVVITGVFGRYLYTFIPRARNGYALAYAELGTYLGGARLPRELSRECRGLVDMIALDFARRGALRRIERDETLTAGQADALQRSVRIASWISALEVADRWFARWSLIHRPLAILLVGTTVLHVLAHFAYAT